MLTHSKGTNSKITHILNLELAIMEEIHNLNEHLYIQKMNFKNLKDKKQSLTWSFDWSHLDLVRQEATFQG